MLMVAAGFLLVRYEWALAANLSQVRTGKHENFARVVFEFQSAVQFDSPKITGKGKFSLVFLNSTTKLPRLTLYKTGKTQLVKSIECVRQKTNLTAIVRLTFPYFILKSYALSAPDRIVVDAYWMSPAIENSGQKAPSPGASATEPPASPAKELKEALQNTPEKAAPPSAAAPLAVQKPGPDELQASQSALSGKTSNKLPEEKRTPPPASKENYIVQTYLLAALDVIAGCIVILLFFMLFNRKQRINIGHLCDILDDIKTSDQSIADIDAQIQSAFKKYDQS